MADNETKSKIESFRREQEDFENSLQGIDEAKRNLRTKFLKWAVFALGIGVVLFLLNSLFFRSYRFEENQRIMIDSEAKASKKEFGDLEQISNISKNVFELDRKHQHEATIIFLKGEVTDANGHTLVLHDVVTPGTVIITGQASVVKILYPDNTQMTIASNSEMEISPKKRDAPNLINLITGQVRVRVSKEIRKNELERREKLIIKTPSAALGIRGTDFYVDSSEESNSTTLVTFEGSVAMVHLTKNNEDPSLALRESTGVQTVTTGMNSVARADGVSVSAPSVVDQQFFDSLKAKSDPQNTLSKKEKIDLFQQADIVYGTEYYDSDVAFHLAEANNSYRYETVEKIPLEFAKDTREFPIGNQ